MAAPRVQTIAQAMADLDPGYAQSKGVIQQQQAALPAKFDAQRSAMHAAKGKGFAQINSQANARGGAFSGVPIDEQSTYLAEKYLPGLQQADFQQNEENLSFLGRLADLDKEQRGIALDRITKQQSDLNSWNMQQQQFAHQSRENEKNRAAQAALAASKGGGGGGNNRAAVIGQLNAYAKSKMGGDKKISPNSFRAGYQIAAQHGMSTDDYTAIMSQYFNSKQISQYAF